MDAEEYYFRVMKLLILRTLAIIVLLTGTGLPVAAEELDAALEAQKKKAQRRIYSERALIADRNLTVPRTETEEERQLDKKLRAMEAALDAQPSSLALTPRPIPVAPRTAEDKNWLTTAVMDELESASMTNETDDRWLARELERQQEAKKEESLIRENELVDKLLREKTELQSSTPELERLKQYQLAPPKLFGSREKEADTPSYMLPQSRIPDPLAAIRPAPRRDPAPPPLFSPEAARMASAPDNDPLRSSRPAAFILNPSEPARPSRSIFSYDNRSEPEPVTLTPIEMMRQSSPINRPNPFADDHMPEFKSSIWQ
jgi:hypothetical protein